MVVAVIVLAGLALSTLFALRSQSTVIAAPVEMATPSSESRGPSSSAPPSLTPSSTPEPIVVHVLGEVSKPGVCQLPAGSRVVDAIAAAGGLRAGADPAELNLAAVLADGSQVVIGAAAEPRGEVRFTQSSTATNVSEGGVIELNTSTAEQLQRLPGVGPVTAAAILEWREANGPFTAVSQLVEVHGIGPKTLAELEGLVSVHVQ